MIVRHFFISDAKDTTKFTICLQIDISPITRKVIEASINYVIKVHQSQLLSCHIMNILWYL